MKVLVVEDYAPLRESLVAGLAEESIVVEWADNGCDGLWMARNCGADVIVLDLMLPKMSGLDLLTELRKKDTHTAVLILTARDGVEDRVKGLNLGADDYLAKPFSFDELLARVHALYRRVNDNRNPVLQVGQLRINTNTREVILNDREIHLSPREYSLLELLAERAGDVISRSDIWENVYEFNSEASSNVVDVYIGYLRRKLAPDAHMLIETVRGHGYRMRQTIEDA